MRRVGSPKLRGWWDFSLCTVIVIFGVPVALSYQHWFGWLFIAMAIFMEIYFIRRLVLAYRSAR